MTEQEQRIALAEFEGWHSLGQDAGMIEHFVTDNIYKVIGIISYEEFIKHRKLELPDYLHDLNAVHEVEKKLINIKADYADHLIEVCCGKGRSFGPDGEVEGNIDLVITATAKQRCEAILKTIGKWKD